MWTSFKKYNSLQFYQLFLRLLLRYCLQFFCLSLEKRCQFKKRRNSSRFRKTKLFFHKKGAESSANEPIWQTLITRYGTVKHTTRYDSCPQKRPQGGLLIIFGKLFFFTFQMVENYSSGEVETRLWLLVKESLFWFSPNIHW